MAQPSSYEGGQGSVPTPNGKDALVQSRKEKTRSRTNTYVDPGTHWIMTMRERDEFVSRAFRVGAFL
jgi:hypothetical protein